MKFAKYKVKVLHHLCDEYRHPSCVAMSVYWHHTDSDVHVRFLSLLEVTVQRCIVLFCVYLGNVRLLCDTRLCWSLQFQDGVPTMSLDRTISYTTHHISSLIINLFDTELQNHPMITLMRAVESWCVAGSISNHCQAHLSLETNRAMLTF